LVHRRAPAGKPSPAVYEEVVRRLDVDPQRADAIEDSSNGCGRPRQPG
jgi:HAD superfamily hydrolase (TIGR01509 family)